jgi:hypothetical protein
MSFSKREIQQYFYDSSQKNFAMMNHVFDEMQKMQSEIKLLKSKVNFQDSVLSSLVRPTLSGIQKSPTNSSSELDDTDGDSVDTLYHAYHMEQNTLYHGYDMEQPPEREKLTVNDLYSDSQTSPELNYPQTSQYDLEEQSLTMDDIFRKSQIRPATQSRHFPCPVPLTRQTNRVYPENGTDTFSTSLFNDNRLTSDDFLKNTYRPGMQSNPSECMSVPLARQNCYVPKSSLLPPYPHAPATSTTTPFNYTCYNPELNWV